jgi:glutathione peroxidase
VSGSGLTTVYDFNARSLAGPEVALDGFRGKVLLVVNTASLCGFTPQYAGLEALFQKFAPRGFAVLGFPCNQFGAQEPGDEAEIGQFCAAHYGVSFPMFAKIDVNGPGAHPLYRFLTRQKPGVLGTTAIKWNFTKFLIDRDGGVVQRFAPATRPQELEEAISRLL